MAPAHRLAVALSDQGEPADPHSQWNGSDWRFDVQVKRLPRCGLVQWTLCRCRHNVHFLRNAFDHLPRKADDDCLQELRWLYDRRSIEEARRDLSAWIAKWSARHPKLVAWVEETIEETLTFYRLPRQHHKHLKSTNMLERLNEEIRRRTYVVRIFPNAESCLRLVRALAVETHENWLEQHRYLNMDDLREHKKEALRCAA